MPEVTETMPARPRERSVAEIMAELDAAPPKANGKAKAVPVEAPAATPAAPAPDFTPDIEAIKARMRAELLAEIDIEGIKRRAREEAREDERRARERAAEIQIAEANRTQPLPKAGVTLIPCRAIKGYWPEVWTGNPFAVKRKWNKGDCFELEQDEAMRRSEEGVVAVIGRKTMEAWRAENPEVDPRK